MSRFIVGGTFNSQGGKASYIVTQLATKLGEGWTCINGGTLEMLANFDVKTAKVLLWMPNIDNAEPKTIDRLKAINPEMLLIQSKRVIEKHYLESDVIGRMLKSHAGLGIMISKDEAGYGYKLLDPLGNLWADTRDIAVLAQSLQERVDLLQSLTRIRSRSDGLPAPALPVPEAFVDLIRQYGTEFARFVNAVNPNRLLGNAATRCTKGFPAVRVADRIWVSRRNVNKETLSPADFVEAWFDGSVVAYKGLNKPSVDTPIQLKLLTHFRNVNYMIHGHVYVEGGLFTDKKVPCGFLEEVDEITDLVDADATDFVVNLRGHGCLLMASSLEFLASKLHNLKGRPFPELPA